MINKILQTLFTLVEPIGFLFLMLLLLTLYLLKKKQWWAALANLVLLVLMEIIGSSPLPGTLMADLERPYVIKSLDSVTNADAVVMLGGCVQASRYEAFGADLTADGDRLMMAMELMRRGKASVLVMGGSSVELEGGGTRIEADLTKKWAEDWKLFSGQVISLGACDNTRHEAIKVAELAKKHHWKRLLLVTSAYHMRRAEATFRSQGLEVVCVPCDFKTMVSVEGISSVTYIPRYPGFTKMSLYIREIIAWRMYRLKGYIQDPPAVPSNP